MKREELLQVAKPILFNTDMVRAILEGRKTVTRRVIKPQPKSRLSYLFAGYGCGKWSYPSKDAVGIWGADYQLPDDLTEKEKGMLWAPPCHTDDILYVRETWQEYTGGYLYKAWPEGIHQPVIFTGMPWKPSIHMPKEAARLFLKVTNVRVERLQDITDEQEEKEGCNDYSSTALGFCYLWDSTIKKPDRDSYGWDANPWVWVIEFERVIEDEQN